MQIHILHLIHNCLYIFFLAKGGDDFSKKKKIKFILG